MVHISEVANAYVSDIRQHLTEGQDVKVMVIGNENGKINLSIKRLEPRQPRDNGGQRRDFGGRGNNAGGQRRDNSGSRPAAVSRAPVQPAAPKTADQIFEEKLKAFMTESDSKLSSIKAYSENRSRPRRKG